MSEAAVYQDVAPRVEAALRSHFPTDTVDVWAGYEGRVHVLVVSKAFNGRSEKERQAMLWDIMKRELGPDADLVAFAIAWGTDELR